MDQMQIKMCDIQGRLFELSLTQSFNSASFIKEFMLSDVAANLDSSYNRMQWAGEEYLLEELMAEKQNELLIDDAQYSKEVLYWSGYTYRYWHYLTGESSKQIYRQASALTMKRNFLMFHTMDPEIAVEDLKEIYKQNRK